MEISGNYSGMMIDMLRRALKPKRINYLTILIYVHPICMITINRTKQSLKFVIQIKVCFY